MKVQVTSRNLVVNESIKEIINNKFTIKIEKLLKKFNNDIKRGVLFIQRDKNGQYIVKFDITLPGKNGNIYSINTHIDLVAAITGLREQLEQQIKRYKANQVNYSL